MAGVGPILVTGASGYIGGRLARDLAGAGADVGCLARDPARLALPSGIRVHRADVLDPESLSAVRPGYKIAYYLIHSMGRGGGGDYADRDARAASNFARYAKETGVEQVIYLGGLGDRAGSPHLRSRLRTGEILRDEGPSLTWVRAGLVVGAGSESFRTLRALVERLPVMLAPAWLKTPTQAIAIADVLRYLIEAAERPETRGREIQIGSAEILTYGDMLDLMAQALGVRKRPRIPVPLLTPWLSSHWIGLVTPVDAGVARPLIEGLATDTTVSDASGMERFDFDPRSFTQALREALAEDAERAGETVPATAFPTSGR
jgi:uncharacterized protein YbjT (DUF2867 family)